jgi:predicted phage terminase large subunit-like protein
MEITAENISWLERVIPSLDDVLFESASRSLESFTELFWPVVEPSTSFIPGWHLGYICEHLEAVHKGQIKNLLINVRPRILKSTITLVMFPAWEWVTMPSLRYLTGAYDLSLAIRDADRMRNVIVSSLYRRMLARVGKPFVLSATQNTKALFQNSEGGQRTVTSVESGGTGKGGHRIVCDDAHDRSTVYSDTIRNQQIDWFMKKLLTRRNNPNVDPVIACMQRMHIDDLSSKLIEIGYEHCCIENDYDPAHPSRKSIHVLAEDPRTEPGEPLNEATLNRETASSLRIALGEEEYSAQFNQRPMKPSGSFFKASDFQRWTDASLPPEFDVVIQSWDMAFGTSHSRRAQEAEAMDISYVVGSVWAKRGANVYLLMVERGQWDVKESIQGVVRMTINYPDATEKLIENKANGPAIMQLLKDGVGGITYWPPHGERMASKLERARAVAPYVRTGHVFLPEDGRYPWVQCFVDEVTGFPFHKRDDQTDVFTQALEFLNIPRGANQQWLENLLTL